MAAAAVTSEPSGVTAVVGTTHVLQGISAASGLEIMPDGHTAYVAGDNTVWLYELCLAPGADPCKVQRRLRLTDSRHVDGATGGVLSEEGIPKKVKPDFEAITVLPYGGTDHIAVFGSASKAGLRDGVVLLDPSTGAAREFDGAALMGALRADPRVTGAAKLNLEAAALLGGGGGAGAALALFHRGNVPGSFNSVVVIALSDFHAYLNSLGGAEPSAAPPPPYHVVHLQLPPVVEDGGQRRSFPAGVSGASTVALPRPDCAEGSGGAVTEEWLLISASYEATLNEMDDGDVLGSRLALAPCGVLIALAASPPAAAPGEGDVGPALGVPSLDLTRLSAPVLAPGGAAMALAKVEGVGARGCSCAGGDEGGGGGGGPLHVIDVLGVTDPDGDESQLLEIRLTVPDALLRGDVQAV